MSERLSVQSNSLVMTEPVEDDAPKPKRTRKPKKAVTKNKKATTAKAKKTKRPAKKSR